MRYLSVVKVAIQGRTRERTGPPRQGLGWKNRRDAAKKNLKFVIIFDIHYASFSVNECKSQTKQPVKQGGIRFAHCTATAV